MVAGEVKAVEALRGRMRIPRKARVGLVEAYEGREEEFEELLSLMVKHAEYFFDRPWPEKLDVQLGLGEEAVEFIEAGESQMEKAERFTLVCLKRNISMEGFEGNFKFYGGIDCLNCAVKKAEELRKKVEWGKQLRRETEEKVKNEGASWIDRDMYEYFKKPRVVREDKMRGVELRFYEAFGGAGGRSCEVGNRFRCPYGAEAERLVSRGWEVGAMWRHIEWYDHHWHPSETKPPEGEMRWYHYGEPDIIDVTSYENLKDASEDGGLDEVVREHGRYMRAMGRKVGAL